MGRFGKNSCGPVHVISILFLLFFFSLQPVFADCWIANVGLYQSAPSSSAQEAIDDATSYVRSLDLGKMWCLYDSVAEPVIDFNIIDQLIGTSSTGSPVRYWRTVTPLGPHGNACGSCDGGGVKKFV